MNTLEALSNAEQLLAQLRQTSALARGTDALSAGPSTPSTGGFSGVLAQSLNRVSELHNTATAQALAFQMGDSDRPLSSVMLDLQRAQLSFQATVQVRNRLVDAYKEIANMAI